MTKLDAACFGVFLLACVCAPMSLAEMSTGLFRGSAANNKKHGARRLLHNLQDGTSRELKTGSAPTNKKDKLKEPKSKQMSKLTKPQPPAKKAKAVKGVIKGAVMGHHGMDHSMNVKGMKMMGKGKDYSMPIPPPLTNETVPVPPPTAEPTVMITETEITAQPTRLPTGPEPIIGPVAANDTADVETIPPMDTQPPN